MCTLSCRENPPYILLHHWIMPCVHYHAGKTRHIFSCITGSCHVYTIMQGKPAIYSPASLDHACVHYHAGKTRHIFSCITGSCHVYTIMQGKPAIYSPASLDHAMCTLSCRENPPYILLHHWIMHVYTITQGKPAIYSPASLDHAMCTLSRRENPPYILLHHWIMSCVHYHAGKTRHIFSCITGSCHVYTITQGKSAIYSPASLDHAMCTLSCRENPPYILMIERHRTVKYMQKT